jgi:Kef-type K+ transport system membrane component KefB
MSGSARDAATFWSVPAVGIAGGLVFLVAAWASGHVWLGVAMLAIMVAFTVAVLVASRYSETVRGLMDRRDERIVSIDVHASAAAGQVLLVVLVVGTVVEFARGRSGAPYSWLTLVGTAAYLGAIVVGRLRR